MILMVCVDKKRGMLFHHRRQSQDRILRERILAATAHTRLWMNAYSAKQFDLDTFPHIHVSETFLSDAAPGEYCFVENVDPSSALDQIEQVILYHWNRDYPADLYFSLDLSPFTLTRTEEFAGSSHETITEEIYT